MTTQAGGLTIPPDCFKNYTPKFENRFLPLINDHTFVGLHIMTTHFEAPPITAIGYMTIMPCKCSHKRKFLTTPLHIRSR